MYKLPKLAYCSTNNETQTNQTKGTTMSTKYIVTRTEQDSTETVVATKAKKQDAIDVANADRASSRRTNTVRTEKGTEVFVVKGVRPMKIVPAYSRTVDLPEDFEVPAGKRVAYTRSRKGIALLHDAESGEYSLFNYVTGETVEEGLTTSRAAGAAVKALPALPKALVAAE